MSELQANCEQLEQVNGEKKGLIEKIRNTPAYSLKPLFDEYLLLDLKANELQCLINDDYCQYIAEFEG